MKTMGFIGCGNMGGAIIRSVAPAKKWHVLVHDVLEETARALASETGAEYAPLDELLKASDIVVLAVKPQILPDLYATLRKHTGKQWISMAAGISLETLAVQLHTENVVRIMPNIAAADKKAVTAVTPHPNADKTLIDTTMEFANLFGAAHRIDEKHFAAFIGVSGSAIATTFSFLHGIAMGGVHEGLPYATALALISDTVESATSLVRESKKHPEELLTQVCSPGGLTIETMQVLYENGFMGILMESVEAASQKALELELKAKTGK